MVRLQIIWLYLGETYLPLPVDSFWRADIPELIPGFYQSSPPEILTIKKEKSSQFLTQDTYESM